jgi:hypothetical protein
MPRVCTICQHPERNAMDKALVAGGNVRAMSALFRVSEDALTRHKAAHLPATLARATGAATVSRADTLLAQVDALHRRTLALLDKAEKIGDVPTALKAIREVRGNVELLARLAGQLQAEQTVNIIVSPEWQQVRVTILAALAPYPEARAAVVAGLLTAETQG